MKELNALERLAKINAENWEPVTPAGTKEILAIADAYWEMKRRAETAEAKLAAARGVKKSWQERAWTAEEKLAELEKQEPIFQIEVSGNHWLNAGPVDDPDFTGLPDGINQLYARPAPAINLAELVPSIEALRDEFEEVELKSDDGFNLHRYDTVYADDETQDRWDLWLSCRAAILRNIEEQSK